MNKNRKLKKLKNKSLKKEFKPKDYIVYPKHGVGQILSINNKKLEE